jgi:hypothetical protein
MPDPRLHNRSSQPDRSDADVSKANCVADRAANLHPLPIGSLAELSR